MLDVGDGQHIYWEVSGNREGKPVVFLHGGPARARTPSIAACSIPSRYRIVLFDQRGCGLSIPHASEPGRRPVGEHHVAPRRRHGTAAPSSASTAGRSSADRGGARSRSPTRRRTPSGSPSWCCAASSPCAARSSTGSTRAARRPCSPTSGRTSSRPVPVAERDAPDRGVRATAGGSRSRGAPAGRDRVVAMGVVDDHAAAAGRHDRALHRARVRHGVRAHREPLLPPRRLVGGGAAHPGMRRG